MSQRPDRWRASMSLDSNKDLVRRASALINRGELDAASECVAVDLVRNGEAVGRAGDRMRDEALATAFPDLEYTVEEMVAEGDRVAVRWRMTGTHSGDLAGPSTNVPASGRRLDIRGSSFYRLQNDVVLENWETVDMMDFLGQLGALDPSDRPA